MKGMEKMDRDRAEDLRQDIFGLIKITVALFIVVGVIAWLMGHANPTYGTGLSAAPLRR